MTPASFSSIQSQTQKIPTTSSQAAMKEGQVVHGTIKKLYPNQTAEVQIGNQKVIAKLETPLKAGDAHFFQVAKSSPELQLRVVTGPLTQGNSLVQQAQQLMQAMNLTKSTEMQAVVQFFLKEQLPISKELLVQTEQLLKQLPPNISMKESLEAIRKLNELKLPLTLQMVETVISGKSTNGMQSLIQDFKLALQQDSAVSANVKNEIIQSLQKLAQPFGSSVAGAGIGKLVETLLHPQTNVAEKIAIMQTLKDSAILPANFSIANTTPLKEGTSLPNTAGDMMQQLAQSPTEDMKNQLRNWINAQPLLTGVQKEEVLSLLKEPSQTFSSSSVNISLIRAFSEQSQNMVFSADPNGITAKEHLLSLLGKGSNKEIIEQTLQQLLSLIKNTSNPSVTSSLLQAEEVVLDQLDGKAFEHAMKEVLKSLGFGYEAKLGKNSEEVRQVAQQLKPQIVDLIQSQGVSHPLKDQAELLLNRMNGLQLLSNENGPQHQLLMQVPLEFLGKKMDATLEWNGRMKEDGKIDSDFARIMFYLQLDALEETVVDMQVQNRVVTITLFNNDKQLQPVANLYKAALKEGLLAVGYKLSGVFVKTFEEQKLSSRIKSPLVSNDSQGVDIRI